MEATVAVAAVNDGCDDDGDGVEVEVALAAAAVVIVTSGAAEALLLLADTRPPWKLACNTSTVISQRQRTLLLPSFIFATML